MRFIRSSGHNLVQITDADIDFEQHKTAKITGSERLLPLNGQSYTAYGELTSQEKLNDEEKNFDEGASFETPQAQHF